MPQLKTPAYDALENFKLEFTLKLVIIAVHHGIHDPLQPLADSLALEGAARHDRPLSVLDGVEL